MYKISVIIPCYNVESYISECLNSVLSQTYQNFEIICIDDGSSDNTLAHLNQFKSKYADKIIVLSKPNGGAPAARNLGLKNATGDLIQFLDADDIISADKFEKQIKGFDDETVDVVVSDRVRKNRDLTEVLQTYTFSEIEINPLETVITRVIITGNPLYRTNVVVQLKGYDEMLLSAQDWDFHIRLVLKNYKIKYIPGVYFTSRMVANSISSNWIKVSIQAAEVILKLKSDLIKSDLMNVPIKQHLSQIYMDSAVYCVDADRSKRYINELLFWSERNYKFVQNRVKRAMIKILGIKIVIALQQCKDCTWKFHIYRAWSKLKL